jgi:hypothetical protein
MLVRIRANLLLSISMLIFQGRVMLGLASPCLPKGSGRKGLMIKKEGLIFLSPTAYNNNKCVLDQITKPIITKYEYTS